ncbi:MAG: hypothetical protein FWE84_05305 [Firmicutes bacterium]|nr:hypothetical protein [Bacillota bacterium]
MKNARKYVISYYKNFDTSQGTFSYDLWATVYRQKKPIYKKWEITIDKNGFLLQKDEFLFNNKWHEYDMKIEVRGNGSSHIFLIIYCENYHVRTRCDAKIYYLFSKYSQKRIAYNEKERKIIEKVLGKNFDN